jgi:hypothetical protein
METRLTYKSKSYDASLMPTMDFLSHFLVLEYRVRLVRCEPATRLQNIDTVRVRGDGILRDGGEVFHLDAWTNAEWNGYVSNFSRIITSYWDDKFELTPNRPWFRASSQHKPAETPVKCYLNVKIVNSAAQAHQTYYIIKPREQTFRSFAWPSRRLGMFTHRDLARSQAIRRTRVGIADRHGHRDQHNIAFWQTTVLHEFGHTLGLNHVLGQGNEDWRYGITREQRDDVMGRGEHLSDRAAQPWISQLRRHLIPEAADRARGVPTLGFTSRLIKPQHISYWDTNIGFIDNVRAITRKEYPPINI